MTLLVFPFQEPTKWQNGDPVAFQIWAGHQQKFLLKIAHKHHAPYDKMQHLHSDSFSHSTDCPSRAQLHCPTKDKCKNTMLQVPLFPQKCHRCAAVLISDFSSPHMISVKCTAKTGRYVICSANHQETHKPRNKDGLINVKDKFCLRSHFARSGGCHNITKIASFSDVHVNCSVNETYLRNMDAFFWYFQDLFDNFVPPPFDFPNNSTLKPDTDSNATYYLGRFCVEEGPFSGMSFSASVFKCSAGVYMSARFVCAPDVHCPDKAPSDTSICVFNIPNFISSNFSKTTGTMPCSPLFIRAGDGSCRVFNFPDPEPSVQDETFNCSSGESIHQDLVDDLEIDCFPNGEDEPKLRNIFEMRVFEECARENQIPCRNGHPKCFNVSEVCKHRLNKRNHLTPCRFGEHLQHCKHFECNGMFKCPNSYCIPWGSVCDGKWQCPRGVDEFSSDECDTHGKCVGLFKCASSVVCIHLLDVCDEEQNCPKGDDEYLCSLKDTICARQCLCVAEAIYCKATFFNPLGNVTSIFSFKVVHLTESALVETNIRYQNFRGLSDLYSVTIVNSNLTEICKFLEGNGFLRQINVSSNLIEELSLKCFTQAKNLVLVDVSGNLLHTLPRDVFHGLEFLEILNMSNNPLELILHSALFGNLPKLKVLSLLKVNKSEPEATVFKSLTFRVLEATNHELCCMRPPGAECSTSFPWYLSCSNLLPTPAIKMALSLISWFIFLLNAVCLFLHLTVNRKELGIKDAFCAITVSINVDDILCSSPLFFLWVADMIFKASFAFVSSKWKSGSVCLLIFGQFFFYGVAHPFLMCFLSISRLMIVKYPLQTQFKKLHFVMRWISYVASGTMLCAVSFTLGTWLVDLHIMHNGQLMSICFPLADPSGSLIMVKVLTWFTVALHAISAGTILRTYTKMIQSLTKTKAEVKTSASKQQSHVSLLVQVATVTCCNILCWTCCGAVYLSAMFVSEYPVDMITWTVITVTPINAFVNPVVFAAVLIRRRKTKK